MRNQKLIFAALFGSFALMSLAQVSLAELPLVELTVEDSVVTTVGSQFMGLQYNGPTHLAIDPATGQLSEFPSAYATLSTRSALQAAGIGMVRVFVDVPQVHPAPGQFDWADTDTAVAEIEASGMVPMLSFNQRDGSWFVGNNQQPWWTIAEGQAEWRALAEASAHRYGDRVATFELLNEPNHIHPTRSSYMGWATSVDLFLGAAAAIHQVVPEASVGGPASFGSWEPATWANKVLAESGGESQLDFVSYHIYASASPNDTDEEIFESTKLYETAPAAIHASLAQATTKPIEVALTEFNTSSVWTLNGALTTDARNVDQMGGLVASLGWLYSLRGGSDRALRFGTMGGFGLIQWPTEYQLQPAYHAVQLIHEIGGLTAGAELLTTAVTSTQASAVETFALRNGDAQAVILVNTDSTESANVAVQFESGATAGAWDVYQYNAERLAAALEPFAQLAMIDGTLQVRVPPQSLVVMRPSEAMISADMDDDFDVDGADFLLWQRGYGFTSQTGNENGDADGNGVVDGYELSGWQNQYGVGTATGWAAIPEPSSLRLVMGALLAVAWSGRKR